MSIGRISHGFDVRPDLCAIDCSTPPRSYLASKTDADIVTPAHFYVDSLVHDAAALRFLLQLFSLKRVILGSDYPFPLGEARPGELVESLTELAAKEKKQILADNCREFLGLD